MSFNYLWTLKEATKRMYQSFRDDIKNQWEKTDWRILKERDRKYIPVKIKERTRNTINGLVTYKCRDYKYYDEQLKKWVRVCLLDEELELPKYKRTCQDIKNNVIEHFADGKRYVDILHTMKQTKFSTTSISRLFQEYQVNKLNVPKIKLEPNQFIYISIDDGHRKFWKFKRNSGKYSMRLVLFCTDNVNHKLVNKRADVIIRPTKTAIGVKKTAEFIKEQGNRFFENFDQTKIIICGDSAGWIKDVADYLGAQFVLDKFHLVKKLYVGIIAGNKGKYWNEYNTCRNFIENGQYAELIKYMNEILKNHKKLKKQYFKNNKQGIENQGAKWNIGCFTEGNIWHILKEMLGNRTYNINIYIKMVIFKCNQINLKT
ncbi:MULTISPECIES: Mbov_0401 family ICE element transposase-like protein [unclassified Spiroplasma]|uniref:Mbov_0401 family ICE element transposase-like protein n=1 Tax=unclassified Spiroplasma TaxID=2637901 RepID=UPI0030CAFB2B